MALQFQLLKTNYKPVMNDDLSIPYLCSINRFRVQYNVRQFALDTPTICLGALNNLLYLNV